MIVCCDDGVAGWHYLFPVFEEQSGFFCVYLLHLPLCCLAGLLMFFICLSETVVFQNLSCPWTSYIYVWELTSVDRCCSCRWQPGLCTWNTAHLAFLPGKDSLFSFKVIWQHHIAMPFSGVSGCHSSHKHPTSGLGDSLLRCTTHWYVVAFRYSCTLV